jgi:hypothetical protein
MDAVNQLPEGLSFQEAKELRSRLISRIDEFSVINKKAPAIGKAKKLVSLMDKQMADSLRGLGKAKTATSGKEELAEVIKQYDEAVDGVEGWDGKLYRAGSIRKDKSTFYAVTKSDAESYAVDGRRVKSYPADDLGVTKTIDVWEEQDEILRLAGVTLDDLNERGLDYNLVIDDAMETLRQQGMYDSVILKNMESPLSQEVPVEVVRFHGRKAEAPQTAYEAWRIANRFYREGQEKYNNTLLRRLVKLADDTGTGAENIAPAIFKPGQVSKVRKVKRALGEGSDEWRNLKGFFIQHLLSKSTDVNGNLVGKRILNNMSGKPNSFGMPVLTEVFTGPQIRALEDFGRVLQATQASQGEGAGRMLIQLAQGTAVGRILLSGAIEPTTAAVILGPPLLSKMLLNPKTAKLLTKGISTPAGSEAAAGLLSRIVAASERVRDRTDE